MFDKFKFEGINKKLFEHSRGAEDRVLVLIRLNGGNDGLNTLIPLDQYDNLVIQRQNVLIPEGFIIPISSTNGLHPSMTGVASLFNDGKAAVIQNVGYPEQNRSHFRSTDIWSFGSLDQATNTGWIGRFMDSKYPNFPEDYPNETNPDPFAISMGYEVSSTCQGLMSNFSHTVPDPFQDVNVGNGSSLDDGTYYGSHMAFLSTMIAQTNAYSVRVKAAADAGNSTSTLYDMTNPLSVYMSNIAQMISGGLKTKVYIVNVNGFDTHGDQVDSTDLTKGLHADLLKSISSAVKSFQDDLALLGIEHRVAGMTFSEFGRQIASNSSFGTDHGDAAPLFLFGTCISQSILGPNPVITDTIVDQAALPMQIDFRDIYASILLDWFEVPDSEIQSLFEHTITYYPVLRACTAGVNELSKFDFKSIVYPNPCVNHATLKFICQNEWVKVTLFNSNGQELQTIIDNTLAASGHQLSFETKDLAVGNYHLFIQKKSGNETIKFMKLKTN